MKKFMCLLCFCLASASVFAEVQTRYTGDALKEIQAHYEAKYKEAGSKWWQALYIGMEKAMLTADLNSMDDVVALEADVVSKLTLSEADKNSMKAQGRGENAESALNAIVWWSYSNSFTSNAFKFYVSKNNINCLRFFFKYTPEKLGLTDKEAFEIYSKFLVDLNYDAKHTSLLIDNYIALTGKVDDETTAKAVLKKLNRKYSQKLIEDKTTWEPLVAKIRTALDTF